MRNIRLLLLVFAVFALSVPFALFAGDKNTPKQNLAGKYERTGEVDRDIEEQFKGLGLVLVRPVRIDELILFPKRGTLEDTKFIVQIRGNGDYLLVLPKAGVTRTLADLGSVVEMEDGSLLLQGTVTITGEGSSAIHGNREDRFTKVKLDGAEWLVVETRINWTKHSWFRSDKNIEYRSLVRYRESSHRRDR